MQDFVIPHVKHIIKQLTSFRGSMLVLFAVTSLCLASLNIIIID